jgi:hypothetical protein
LTLSGAVAGVEIHKPKATHNWREFLTEIGTIVCGILIALGLEQAVEALHSHHLVEQAEEAMRGEIINDDGPQAYVRLAVAPCLSHQLDGLRAALDKRIAPEAFGKLAASYQPVLRTWDDQALKAAQGSGVLSAMGPKKLNQWSEIYVQIPNLRDDASTESDALKHLRLTRFKSGAWTQAHVDELSDVLDTLESANRKTTANSAAQIVFMKGNGLELPVAAEKRALAEAHQGYGDCVVQPDLSGMEALRSAQVVTPEQQALAITKLMGR